MPTPAKTRPKPKASQSQTAFLRFRHSDALRVKTLAVLVRVEKAEDPVSHRGALADLVVDLTNAGMEGYFLAPLADAKAGFLVQQSAKLGMTGAIQVVGSVIRNILGRMDAPQLLSVCASIRRFMR